MCSDALRKVCAGRIDAEGVFRNGLSCSEDAIVAGSQGFVQSLEPMSSCKAAQGGASCPLKAMKCPRPRAQAEHPCMPINQGASWRVRAWCAGRAGRSPGQWGSAPGTRWRVSAWRLLEFNGWAFRMMHLHPPRIGGNLHEIVTFPWIRRPQVQPERMSS